MDIKYTGHETRTKNARNIWFSVATDLNSGMSIEEIRQRYTNPLTGKPYSKSHIYFMLRYIKNTPIN
jgi:hypothetical protein